MISQNQAAETQIALNSIKDSGALRGEVKIKVHDKYGNDVGILDMYEGYEIGSGIENDSFLNQSLDTAKVIFSKLAAGNIDYKIAKIARDLEKAGYPVIHLELGDPEIEVNHDIAYELYRAAMMGYTHYGDPRGVEPLREKLSEHLNNKLKVNVTKENISYR